jgi:hypothetical protein
MAKSVSKVESLTPFAALHILTTCTSDARLSWLRELTEACQASFTFRALALFCVAEEINCLAEFANQYHLFRVQPWFVVFHSETRARLERELQRTLPSSGTATAELTDVSIDGKHDDNDGWKEPLDMDGAAAMLRNTLYSTSSDFVVGGVDGAVGEQMSVSDEASTSRYSRPVSVVSGGI